MLPIIKRTITLRAGQEVNLFSACDLHLGSAAVDVTALKRDLKRAAKLGARIGISGDVLDCILPKDHKRYTPAAVIRRLWCDEPLDAAVDYAEEILSPYARLIDWIGIGNHEAVTIHYHGTNPVARLVDRLNRQPGVNIDYGDYSGYVIYTLVRTGSTSCHAIHVLYSHGAGGESPVTKGAIDVNRKSVNWDYDLFVFGHKHNKLAIADVRMGVNINGKLYSKDTRAAQCGGYLKSYLCTEDLAKEHFRSLHYPELRCHAPKPIGGVFCRMGIERRMGKRDADGKRDDVTTTYVRVEI